jgi:hypothetical protein
MAETKQPMNVTRSVLAMQSFKYAATCAALSKVVSDLGTSATVMGYFSWK